MKVFSNRIFVLKGLETKITIKYLKITLFIYLLFMTEITYKQDKCK